MKKLILILLVFVAVQVSAQLTPIPNFRIQNATTEFGIPIPQDATVYDYNTGTWYRATAAIASTATLTTASGNLIPISDSEVNDLSSAVTWVTVPDLYISQSSVIQHQASLSITESQISDLTHFTGADITGNETAFTGWDKNAADDFSGDYNDLTSLPTLFDGLHSSLTLDDGTNPHGTTASDVGLGNVENAAASLLYEPIFSKNTAFNKNFGTLVGTVAEGNDSRFHDQVTLSGSYDYITRVGQILTLNQIDYLSDISNTPTIPSGNQIIDWTAANQGTIDPTNYVDNNTQLSDGDIAAFGYIKDGNTNWDNVYGFITGYTETDPIFGAHTVSNIINGTGLLRNNGSGTWSYDNSSYITGNQNITLSGDASGSGTTSISVTVADDSHNHIISNIDGLQTTLDGKVDENASITGGTFPKITFDSKGLVTGGSSLLATDIPTLTASKISDFDTEVSNNTDVSANSAKVSFPGFSTLLSDYGFTDNSTNWNTAYSWGDWETNVPSTTMTFTNKSGSNSQWTNDEGYITDGNTNWDNSYGFITGNETITLSGETSGSGTTSITTTVSDNVIDYGNVDETLKQAVTNNTLAWDLAASGIIFSAVSSTGTISFTDYEINQGTIIRLTISGGATISWPSTAKIQEGSQALGDGTFNISILPLSSTIFLVSISKDAA